MCRRVALGPFPAPSIQSPPEGQTRRVACVHFAGLLRGGPLLKGCLLRGGGLLLRGVVYFAGSLTSCGVYFAVAHWQAVALLAQSRRLMTAISGLDG